MCCDHNVLWVGFLTHVAADIHERVRKLVWSSNTVCLYYHGVAGEKAQFPNMVLLFAGVVDAAAAGLDWR